MAEKYENSNNLTSNLISRNTPVAFVVGAAGFLGSHLVDDLLKKDLQVIGIDNFSTGKKMNLTEAVKNKRFHIINSNAQSIKRLNLPRLDYLVFVSDGSWDISEVLKITKDFKPKIVFVSHIELYDKEQEKDFKWFKLAEAEISDFATQERLNARIVRLANVYGPRMHFKYADPVIKLIHSSLKNSLHKGSAEMDFTSRAIFVDDAISLILKSIFTGASASKIFDGSLLNPVKVSEVKQILLDPDWHESRKFNPTLLPPWSTPNLEKTVDQLNWRPKTDLIDGLKRTLKYFKEEELEIPEMEERQLEVVEEKLKTDEELKKKIDLWKKGEEEEPRKEIIKAEKEQKGSRKGVNWAVLAGLIIIIVGLVYPLASLGLGVLTFRYQLTQASNQLQVGDFDKSLDSVKKAKLGIQRAQEFTKSLEVLKSGGVLVTEIETVTDLLEVGEEITTSTEQAIKGSESLYEGVKSVSTGKTLGDHFQQAQTEFSAADQGYSRSLIELQGVNKSVPEFLKPRTLDLEKRLENYSQLAKKGRSVASVLPDLVAKGGKKTYLLTLVDNNEIRGSGGVIRAVGLVDFEDGKLVKVDVQDPNVLNSSLDLFVTPPVELKEDLGVESLSVKDSTFEPDFPTSARQTRWFIEKTSGKKIDGVISLDLTAVSLILEGTGELEVKGERVNSENLNSKALKAMDNQFFIAVLEQISKELPSLKQDKFLKTTVSLNRSLDQKHTQIYISDPKLFAFFVSQNWTGVLPRQDQASKGDLLVFTESNMGKNKASYLIDRVFALNTTVVEEKITHRLKVGYTNRSNSEKYPEGNYKNRVKVYVPTGATLTKASWGEVEITKDVKVLSDYGRVVFSLLLNISPKEQRNLILEYQLPKNAEAGSYKLNVLKQAGTGSDPFEWTYPKGEISTNLSTDRTLEVNF